MVHSPNDPVLKIQLTEGMELSEAICSLLQIKEAIEEHFVNPQLGEIRH
jgi:hypothetical protein